MALTIAYADKSVMGDKRVHFVNATFDSSYASGGESLTPSDVGLKSIDYVAPAFNGGYHTEYDHTNQKLKAYVSNLNSGLGAATGAVTDDDSAASNGTAVNVVPTNEGEMAYLESATANNADAVYAVGSGGPTLVVNDNDSPGGVQLYFDEDAANADSRFLAVLTNYGAVDHFVRLSNGEMIRVKHDASAASNGVAVYFDDDAANNYERLLFVSPTNADGSFTTDDTVGPVSSSDLPLTEVAAATNLSSVTARLMIVGN